MPESNKSWPPPPDLASIQELVATADIESFIADGAPADEYETEAEEIFKRIHSWPQTQFVQSQLVPVLEQIWAGAFTLNQAALAERREKLEGLAAQIERFFGPEARPQVRGV